MEIYTSSVQITEDEQAVQNSGCPHWSYTASGQNEAQFDFEAENKISVDGVPDTGWKFKKWIGLPKENDTISYTLLDSYLEYAEFEPLTDVNLTAQFEKDPMI